MSNQQFDLGYYNIDPQVHRPVCGKGKGHDAEAGDLCQ